MEFSPIFVSLAQGLKESIAADAVNPGAGALVLENYVLKQKEELVPRDGSPAISNLDISGASVPTAWRLGTRGQSLLRFGQYGAANALHVYSPSRDRWVPVSSTIKGPVGYDLTTVAGGQIAAQSSAYLPGYVAIGLINAAGEGEARIVDESTGATLYSQVFTASGGETGHVRALACNSLFVWLADDYDNQQIVSLVLDPSNPAGISHFPSVGTIHPFQSCLDAIVVGNTVHAAYAMANSTVQGLTLTPAVGGGTTSTYEIVAVGGLGPHLAPTECMSFVRDLGGSGKIGLVCVDVFLGVTLHWDINATGLPASGFVIEAAQALTHHTLNVTACTTSNAAGGDVQVVIEFHPSDLFVATVAGALAGVGVWNSAGAGVGKTLTSSATGVQAVDAHNLVLNDIVLVTGGVFPMTAKDFGLYKVTTAGAVGVAAVLTRATNFDTAAKITRDALVRVTAGAFARAQYHVAKVLDSESSPTTFAPGTFTLDESALSITFVDPTLDVHHQPITNYRRYDRYLWTANKTAANAVTSALWTRGLGLTSHAYAHGGNRFVWANYDNDGEAAHQGSYFLLQLPATIATGPATPQAAFAVDFEAGIQPNSHVQDVAINQVGNALGAVIVRADAIATDDGQRSIQLAEITLNPSLGHPVELGGSLFMPGGILGQYDGQNYFPPVFPFAPDGLSAVPSATIGGLGSLAAGTVNATGTAPPGVTITGTAVSPAVVWIECTVAVAGWSGTGLASGKIRYSVDRGASYSTAEFIQPTIAIGATGLTANFPAGSYAVDNKWRTTSETVYRLAAVFRATDGNGRAIRSAPSFFDVTLFAGQSSISVEWIPIYHFADKPNPFVEVYRSPANLPDQLNLNIFGSTDPTIVSGSASAVETDGQIAARPLLYTSGGVEAHVPAGGLSDLCFHSQRLIAVSMDDPTKLLTMTPLADGEVPAFTDSGAIQVPAVTYAVANYLDNLVVFSEDATRIQAPSDGPNSQGQGTWPQLQPIEGGTTTTQPRSVCVTPDGLGFASKNAGEGYQVVTRSLTIEAAGLDVQAQLSAATLIDTIYVPAKSQTRIYLDNSTALAWDHVHQQWSTYTSVPSLTATLWRGKPVYFTSFGVPAFDACRVETPGYHFEGLGLLTYKIESPWQQLAVLKGTPYPNVGGYERVRRCIGVGRMLGAFHNLLVEIFADGNITTPIAQYAGTMTTDWNWRIRTVGKISRIKARITVLNCADAGVAIRGITLEIAGKAGLQRFGSNLAPA